MSIYNYMWHERPVIGSKYTDEYYWYGTLPVADDCLPRFEYEHIKQRMKIILAYRKRK